MLRRPPANLCCGLFPWPAPPFPGGPERITSLRFVLTFPRFFSFFLCLFSEGHQTFEDDKTMSDCKASRLAKQLLYRTEDTLRAH